MKNTIINYFNSVDLKKLFTKKNRYLVVSFVLTTLVFYVTTKINTQQNLLQFIILLSLTVLISMILMYLLINESLIYTFFSHLLPVHLIIGFVLSVYYFPNLALPIIILGYIAFGVLNYIVFLVNNIFLVIQEKGSLIPLYSVAITWVQILIIVIAIPFYSGVYKLPLNILLQGLIVLVSSSLFYIYTIWGITFDTDVKKTDSREKLAIVFYFAFITYITGLAVSFIPTETFLKAMFVAAVNMFSIAYIYAHYKNRITTRLLLEYGIICLIFFLLLIIFRPV